MNEEKQCVEEHCGHECGGKCCSDYHIWQLTRDDNAPCPFIESCDFDTRTHHHIGDMILITREQIDEIERLFNIPEHAMEDEDYQSQKDIIIKLRGD